MIFFILKNTKKMILSPYGFFGKKILIMVTMDDIETKNKRRLERFDLEIPAKVKVTVSAEVEEVCDLLTNDISSGGAFFHTDEPLPEGTTVEIDLILPLSKLIKTLEGSSQYTRIKVNGQVLRSESKGMAVSFHEDYQISPWNGRQSTEH